MARLLCSVLLVVVLMLADCCAQYLAFGRSASERTSRSKRQARAGFYTVCQQGQGQGCFPGGCPPGHEALSHLSNILGCGSAGLTCCRLVDSRVQTSRVTSSPLGTTDSVTSPPWRCGQNYALVSSRIFGSRPSQQCAWPWMVSVRMRLYFTEALSANNSLHQCAGAIIAPQWVLTTPFCLMLGTMANQDFYNNVLVVAGEHRLEDQDRDPRTGRAQEQYAGVSEAYLYPGYLPGVRSFQQYITAVNTQGIAATQANAFALLKLSRPLTLSDCVYPVCLPRPDTCPGSECFLAGWGFNEKDIPSTLSEAQVRVFSREACNEISFVQTGERRDLPENTLCMRGVSSNIATCAGDQGGPVVCNDRGTWRLVGSVLNTNTCNATVPQLLSNVADQPTLDWINSLVMRN